MAQTAEDILEQVRALPERERLRFYERIVREVREQTPPVPVSAPPTPTQPDAIWADVSDEDFDDFMTKLGSSRREPWRSTG